MNKNSTYGFGWYLKEADKAITRYISKVLEKQGLTRFHWQIMNRTYLDGIAIQENLYAKNYVGESGVEEIIQSLLERKWIKLTKTIDHKTQIQLTNKGKEAYHKIAALIKKANEEMFQVITKEEYENTIDVLTRFIHHMGSQNT